MRQYNFFLISLLLLLCSSCSEDNVGNGQSGNQKAITASIQQMDFGGELGSDIVSNYQETRSTCVFSNNQFLFPWEQDELIVVFSDENVQNLYRAQAKENSTSATFTGGGFDLSEGKQYYSFNGFGSDAVANEKKLDMNNIVMDYAGQTQIGNDNYSHLAKYAFFASTAIAGANNSAHFNFKHVGSILRFFLTMPDVQDNEEFTELELIDYNSSDPSKVEMYQTKQSLDIDDNSFGDATNYKPQLVRVPLSGSETKENTRFKLAIKNDVSAEEGITISKGGQLKLYMFIPSMKLKGQKILGVLSTKSSRKYYFEFGAIDFAEGSFYTISRTLAKTGQLTLNIKVDPYWKKGETQLVTRATTGDPGYDKGVHPPKYLYPYVYVNGADVHDVQSIAMITTSPTDWNQTADGVYVYNNTVSTTWTGTASSGNVYVIASDYLLTQDELAAATTETNMKSLVINVPSFEDAAKTTTDVEEGANITQQQDFLKNLYSTPCEPTSVYEGQIHGLDTETPTADVTLYHVAAKIDMIWNSSVGYTSMAYTGLRQNNIKVFQPTSMTTSDTGETFDYTITLNGGNKYNGRKYFYAIQEKQTAGENTGKYVVNCSSTESDTKTTPLVFTPAEGYASWFLGEIK